MLAGYYGGQPAAVIIEENNVEVLYANTGLRGAPTPQLRRVGTLPSMRSDRELENFFANRRSIGPILRWGDVIRRHPIGR